MTLLMHNKIFLCACEQQDKGTQPSKIYIAYDIVVIDSSMQSERQDAVCVCVCVCFCTQGGLFPKQLFFGEFERHDGYPIYDCN
jgi:hypothetical protein